MTTAPGPEAAGPYRLRTEYADEPLGIDERRPRFSWLVRGSGQVAYQVLVASEPASLRTARGDVWDSGRVESTDTVQVEYAGGDLASTTRYHWAVRVWDADGASDWSEPAAFETGLLEPDDWAGATWIGRDGGPAAENSAPAPGPLLRRAFRLSTGGRRRRRRGRRMSYAHACMSADSASGSTSLTGAGSAARSSTRRRPTMPPQSSTRPTI